MFRIVPVLTIIEGNLVKTTAFKKPRYIGDPVNAVKIFNDKEVDEVILLDIGASKAGSGISMETLSEVVSEAFMPMAYGGAITSVEDMRSIFFSGVEKVVIGSASRKLELVREAASLFGSQSVVACLDFKKNRFASGYKMRSGRKFIRVDSVAEEVARVCDSGAGEVIISSTRRDGTLSGIDGELTAAVKHLSEVPLVYLGGASSEKDMRRIEELGFSGVGVGARFVYKGPRNAVLISYNNPFATSDLEY
ncbi:HisA/HisF-related TIM barrel protein [Luminiphilus sp.]|nr:HisA/HisF-related TIM barrel protein [Luminiphilus sp.]